MEHPDRLGPESPTARLGAVIRARRLQLGLSQEELADQLGLVRSRLSAIENGQVGQVRLLVEVCTALGLELLALPREDSGTAALVAQQRELVERGRRRRTPSRSHPERGRSGA